MKCIIVFCLLSVAVITMAKPKHDRGCIYILGRCSRECEEGTHAYALGCGKKTPEATCEVPEPVQEEHMLCDYSACYCDPPTVRDVISGRCMPLNECPKKESETIPL